MQFSFVPKFSLACSMDIGESIKPQEGAFVMAKEYQKWRTKALAYLRWMDIAVQTKATLEGEI